MNWKKNTIGIDMGINKLRANLERKKGRREQIEDDLAGYTAECEDEKENILCSEKAQGIIQAVAKLTQEQLEYMITEPVSLALAAVFDNPYKFVAKFEITGKGTIECKLGFERDGTINDIHEIGGGVVDVASFALRVSAWSLAQPRTSASLIFDEPFRSASSGVMPQVSEMVKNISSSLDLQIIMISHITGLIDCADKIFETNISKGISTITERNNE